MRVKLEINEDGEYFAIIPDDIIADLQWEEGDELEWDDYDDYVQLHLI